MVSLLCFFYHFKIFIKHFFLWESNTINTCHLVFFSITSPECTCYTCKFNCFNRSCTHKMGTFTQVSKRALCISRNSSIFQIKVNMFAFILLTICSKLLHGVCFRYISTHNGFIFLSQFAHFIFYFREIIFTNSCSLFRHYVIEKTIFNRRTKAKLYAWI